MLYSGAVARDVANVHDQVMVTVVLFDKEIMWGPMPWMPRVDDAGLTVLPQEGDPCIVALAATDEPGTPDEWMIGYWSG